MLLGAQHAYDRGHFTEMKRLAQGARDVYQAREVYERCAQVDLMLARTLEDNLNQTDHGDHERASVDTALSLALPAALALEAARYDFVTAHARSQWLELADDAMQLVFRLAVRRQDQGLLFELVEHRCAGAFLALDRTPLPAGLSGLPGSPDDTGSVFPSAAMKAYGPLDGPVTLGGVAAEAAASAGLRVAPPPKVRMSSESGRVALQEYIAAAEFRYHRRIVNETETPFWVTDDLTSRPVVQVRLADAGDLFITWTWAGGARGFGTGHGPEDEVATAVRALAAALPGPVGAGGGAEGMRRAFGPGALADHRGERRLARMLAEALWPEELTAQIRQVSARAGRPLVRIQPSPGSPRSPGNCSPSMTTMSGSSTWRTWSPPRRRRCGVRTGPPQIRYRTTPTPVRSYSSSTPGSRDSGPTPRSARSWDRRARTRSCCRSSGTVSTRAPSCRPSAPRRRRCAAPTWTGTG